MTIGATRQLLRWSASALGGALVVYLLLIGGLYFSGWFEDDAPATRRVHAVDLLSEIERVRLKDTLDLGPRRAPSPPPPPPVRLPRQVSGFVQLEVEVGADGAVQDARVLGAVPEGYYEAEALEEVRSRSYEPSPLGPYRQTEVVPFTVTAEAEDVDAGF